MSAFIAGSEKPLVGNVAAGPTSSNYDVTSDGERFLMVKDDDQDSATSRRAIVVLGWADELNRLSKA